MSFLIIMREKFSRVFCALYCVLYEKKLAVEKAFSSDLISDNKTGSFWSVVLNMKIGFCSISRRLSLGGKVFYLSSWFDIVLAD